MSIGMTRLWAVPLISTTTRPAASSPVYGATCIITPLTGSIVRSPKLIPPGDEGVRVQLVLVDDGLPLLLTMFT